MIDLDHIQAILFDLDGTLVDVDMQRFIPAYLRLLTARMGEHGVSPARATTALHHAVDAMFANTLADRTLEDLLHEVLQAELCMTPGMYAQSLATFCRNDLATLSPLVTGHPLASRLVEASLDRGWQVVLATNPIFPRVVVDARLNWGALDSASFHHVTAYETSHFCKPNPAFFEEILDRLQLPAQACLMVGNDTLHDLSASRVGLRTCLLTPWRIHRPDLHFRADWQGRHEELLGMIEAALPGQLVAGGGCPD